MNPKEDLMDWVLRNYRPAISDFIDNIVEQHAKASGWKLEDVGELLDVLHYELREAILNVIATYEEEVTE